jgi:hypothetical protein
MIWRADHPDVAEPPTGTVRTRSKMAALITAAVELLHAGRLGLEVRTWKVRLWNGRKWGPPRIVRVLNATCRRPRRVWVVGIGVYDEAGDLLRPKGKQEVI